MTLVLDLGSTWFRFSSIVSCLLSMLLYIMNIHIVNHQSCK